MANPLPVYTVASLSDALSLPHHDGPCRVILARAGSLGDACAMLSVLREKGLLQTLHAAAEEHEGEGSGSGSDLGPDEDAKLRLLRRNPYAATRDAVPAAARDAVPDQAAPGCAVDNLPSFRYSMALGLHLEECINQLLLFFDRDAGIRTGGLARIRRCDLDLIRSRGLLIRRVGKLLPGLMGQEPVTLGNYLNHFVHKALQHAGSEWMVVPWWMAARRRSVLERVRRLYEEVPVDFTDADAW